MTKVAFAFVCPAQLFARARAQGERKRVRLGRFFFLAPPFMAACTYAGAAWTWRAGRTGRAWRSARARFRGRMVRTGEQVERLAKDDRAPG